MAGTHETKVADGGGPGSEPTWSETWNLSLDGSFPPNTEFSIIFWVRGYKGWTLSARASQPDAHGRPITWGPVVVPSDKEAAFGVFVVLPPDYDATITLDMYSHGNPVAPDARVTLSVYYRAEAPTAAPELTPISAPELRAGDVPRGSLIYLGGATVREPGEDSA